MQEWHISRETGLSVQQATERVEKAAAEVGFGVLHTHDVSQTIRGKGFECPEYRIVEVCSAKYASEAIAADPRVGLWMPCPIAIFEQGGKTHVQTVKTTLLAEFFPNKDLGGFAEDVEDQLIRIIESALR